MTVGRVIDLSSNNHPHTVGIDWPKVKAAGVTTVLVKATEGTTYVNPWFARDTFGAVGQGLDVLAYHYKGEGAGAGTPGAEAKHFIAIAGVLAKILDGEMSTDTAWINGFLQALGFPSTRLLYYGSAGALGGIRGQLRAMIWVAAYGQGYPGYGVLWQFTNKATVDGITGPVDENSWHGTEEQYARLFGKFDPPPPITTTPLSEEELMGATVAVAPNGDVHIAAVGKGNGRTDHLLHVTVPPAGNPSVIDLTLEIAGLPGLPPGTPEYLVAP